MSGFVAIIARDRQSAVRDDEIGALVDSYESLRGPARRHAIAGGNRARLVTFAASPASGSGLERCGSSWAAVVGRPHHQSALVGSRLEDLDGQFALATYDDERDEVVIASDPLGMHTLFVADQTDRTYVSTSVLALAKHLRATPSVSGISAYLRTGYHVGKATNWEGIERVEPATRLRFSRTASDRSVYWQPTIDESVGRLSFHDAVDFNLEVATETVRASYAGHAQPWVDLTGGFDTRLLSLLLRRADVPFCAITNGAEGDDDVTIAAAIARVAGWDCSRLMLPDDWPAVLPTMVPAAVAWGNGQMDALQLADVMWLHRERAHRPVPLLSGGGGEHYRGYAWSQEFLRAGRSTRVNYNNWLDMKLLAPMDESLFRRNPTTSVRNDLRACMMSRAQPYSHLLNTVQLDVLDAYKSTSHFGTYLSAAAAWLEVENPLYLKPLFLSAISTPYQYRNGARLMRHMIHRLNPQVAALPTTSGGPAEPWRATNLHRFAPYYGKLVRKAAAKLAQQRSGPRDTRRRGRVTPSVQAVARSTYIRQLRDDGRLQLSTMRSGCLYDSASVERLMRGATDAGSGFAAWAIVGRIVTVELALEAADAAL